MSQVAGLIALSNLVCLGRECDLSGSAAPLHDIGKIAIPDAVLLKRSTLNEEEMAMVRRHPRIGCEFAEWQPEPLYPAGCGRVALRHHEALRRRWLSRWLGG